MRVLFGVRVLINERRYLFVYGSSPLQLNTFQCVLILDGEHLFTLFLYKDIQWITGDTDDNLMNGLDGSPAQIGFNAGDGVNSFSIPLSQTASVLNVTETSNIGVPGAWAFLVSGASVISGGCVDNQGEGQCV